MKNIKFILAFFVMLSVTLSCDNDGGDSRIATKAGTVPDIQKLDGFDDSINFIAINNGEDISLSFTVDIGLGAENFQSLDVVLFYIKSDGTINKHVLDTGVTDLPKTYTLNLANLYDYFDDVNVPEDFTQGDQLIVTTAITLKDGTVINMTNDDGSANYGPNIATAPDYAVVQVYAVACPSDLEGTYNVLTTATSTDPGPSPSENPIADFPYQVTITATGGGSYTISDAFGGVYMLWYDIYGLDFEVEGTFNDVCGTISGTFEEPFGTNVVYDGTVNPDGTLTIHWINGYDDEGVSVFTPAD